MIPILEGELVLENGVWGSDRAALVFKQLHHIGDPYQKPYT